MAHAALLQYVKAFEAAGALDGLEAFLQPPRGRSLRHVEERGGVVLEKRAWVIPENYKFGESKVGPLRTGGGAVEGCAGQCFGGMIALV